MPESSDPASTRLVDSRHFSRVANYHPHVTGQVTSSFRSARVLPAPSKVERARCRIPALVLFSVGEGATVKYGVVAAAVLSLGATSAESQSTLTLRACASDIKAQCPDVAPGEGRIRGCVKEHLQGFSGPCQARLARFATINRACRDEVKESCGGVEPRRGRVEDCVKAALAKAGEACRESLARVVAGRR
jgi:hypothetical protein